MLGQIRVIYEMGNIGKRCQAALWLACRTCFQGLLRLATTALSLRRSAAPGQALKNSRPSYYKKRGFIVIKIADHGFSNSRTEQHAEIPAEMAEEDNRAMKERRVLVLSGPRQCGKTTLVRQLASKNNTRRGSQVEQDKFHRRSARCQSSPRAAGVAESPIQK